VKELLGSVWDAMLFKSEAYERHIARSDVLKRGLLLIVVVTLLAGLLSFAIDLVRDMIPKSIEERRQAIWESIENPLQFMGPAGSDLLPPEYRKQLPDIMAGVEIGLEIEALPTPLPRFFVKLFENGGAFLSLPFSRLGGWMWYALWVLLAAKLLGGRATLPQMLGGTALFIAPHILDLFGFIPCLGGLLGLVAALWGIAIYVKAVATANEFGVGRAVVATLLPIVFFVGVCVLVMLSTSLIGVLSSS